jgi:Subtilase family
MAKAELNAPDRQRIFALAVTATDAPEFKENGKPSAWSAALDSYTAGYLEEGDAKRLICVSAGNAHLTNATDYLDLNDLSSIEDPGQSWKALTVGAFTEKDTITDEFGKLMGVGGLSLHEADFARIAAHRIRYSLVISIESLGLEIDLYTPIANALAQVVSV